MRSTKPITNNSTARRCTLSCSLCTEKGLKEGNEKEVKVNGRETPDRALWASEEQEKKLEETFTYILTAPIHKRDITPNREGGVGGLQNVVSQVLPTAWRSHRR